MILPASLLAAAAREVPEISLLHLAIAFVPVAILLAIQRRWSLGLGKSLLATARMTLQLLAVGYMLMFILDARTPWIVLAALSGMIVAAGWIAMRSVGADVDRRRFGHAVMAIAAAGVPTLTLVTQAVLQVDPWFAPREWITLGSMIFANSMNVVSLAGERFLSERSAGRDYETARRTAMNASLIPLTNSMLAVGIVSLPGMMTGQVLAGN